jgi:hypothetical protein
MYYSASFRRSSIQVLYTLIIGVMRPSPQNMCRPSSIYLSWLYRIFARLEKLCPVTRTGPTNYVYHHMNSTNCIHLSLCTPSCSFESTTMDSIGLQPLYIYRIECEVAGECSGTSCHHYESVRCDGQKVRLRFSERPTIL